MGKWLEELSVSVPPSHNIVPCTVQCTRARFIYCAAYFWEKLWCLCRVEGMREGWRDPTSPLGGRKHEGALFDACAKKSFLLFSSLEGRPVTHLWIHSACDRTALAKMGKRCHYSETAIGAVQCYTKKRRSMFRFALELPLSKFATVYTQCTCTASQYLYIQYCTVFKQGYYSVLYSYYVQYMSCLQYGIVLRVQTYRKKGLRGTYPLQLVNGSDMAEENLFWPYHEASINSF